MKLKAKNPISNESINLTDPKTWIENVLGVLFLFVVLAGAQNVAKVVEQKTKIDTSVEPLTSSPVMTTRTKQII